MTDIWAFPAKGAVPDLEPLLEADTLEDFLDASDPFHSVALAGTEAMRDRATARARATADDLRKQGIHVDVDRIVHGSFWDRLMDSAYDVLDWWLNRKEKTAPEADVGPPTSVAFAVMVPLAMTHSTWDLSLSYDQIDADVDRMVDALSRQITVARGRGPMQVAVPDAVVDELSDAEEYSETSEMILSAADVRGYWPPEPSGAPALCLSVEQADGGQAIEVDLFAHGAPAHQRFVRTLADVGGQIT